LSIRKFKTCSNKKEGKKEGLEKGQDYVLELMAQGLSYEEIKKKIKRAKT